jgi:hypothetical protein
MVALGVRIIVAVTAAVPIVILGEGACGQNRS